MTTPSNAPLQINASAIGDLLEQSRARALEARQQVTELTPEEIAAVGGGSSLSLLILRGGFPYGKINPDLWRQLDVNPAINQTVINAGSVIKY